MDLLRVVSVSLFVVLLETDARAQCGDLVLHNFLEAGGTSGVVLTSPRGAAVVGGNFGLRVENAAPGALGFLVWSGNESPVFDPVFGVTIYAGAPFSARFFATNASGSSPLLFPTPKIDPELCGAQAVFQAGVFDNSAPGGAAITNALRVRVGDPNRTLFPEIYLCGSASDWLSDMLFADMNGDGVNDCLRANDPNNAFDSIFLQLGLVDGGFEPPYYPGVPGPIQGPRVDMFGHRPQALAVADFDGDGKLDVATANIGSHGTPSVPSGATVVLGDGAGSFTAKANFASGTGSQWIAVADFDLDGNVDAVTADRLDDTLSVLLGDGLGGLGAAQPFAVGPDPSAGLRPYSVAAGDLDEDGFADLVSTSSGAASLSVLLADGPASFAPAFEHAVGITPWDVVLADFDGDTVLDAVNLNNSPDSISFSRGLGDGSFAPSVETLVGHDPRDLVVGDVDGDQDLDVATPDRFDDTVTVLFGDGAGAFTASTVDAAGIANNYGTLALGDADHDGDQDLFVDSGVRVYAHLNRGDGSFPDADGIEVSSDQTTYISAADFDSDKHLDLVALSPNQGTVSVLLGRADGTMDPPISYPLRAIDPFLDNQCFDFNGDGAPDVRIGEVLMFGNGDGTLAPPVPFAMNLPILARGDFDGDDVLDLVVIKPTLPAGLEVRLGNGDGTFGTPSATIAWGTGFFDVAVGDLDSDGNQDLVLADHDLDRVVTAFGDGAGGFPTLEVKQVGGNPDSFHLVDLDQNGSLELLLYIGNTLSVMPVLPTGLFGAPAPTGGEFIYQTNFTNGFDTLVDVNEDGALDFVHLTTHPSATSSTEASAALLGNGDLTFGRLTTYYFRTEGDHELGDFDGDGILDIAAAGPSGITIYPNLLGE